ncbi:hypothetical protein MXD61_25825 [Frankia sp. AgPm24]|uniref:hypothetical protein n=1 Tax=Frankia sp. AgPm24 TaxID=631128 RepID=UPI00200FF681|nr:hypothetical protein [Frankia sp. AgPm24]MCK9925251.1 hypothetical protein [Frankia sp. AgPm24]
MSSLLTYTLITDPVPLVTSPAGGSTPSVGAVHVLATNTQTRAVKWRTIDVHVPVGTGAGDLTTSPGSVQARIENAAGATFGWQSTAQAFRASASPTATALTVAPGASIVLVLTDIPVSTAEGAVALTIQEEAAHGTAQPSRRTSVLGLLKKAPRRLPIPDLPRDFRPERSLVAKGSDVVLRWEGRADLTYTIVGPDGTPRPASGGRWAPPTADAPQRDATYTLVATDGTRSYSLTTTVHLRTPTFDAVTVTGDVTVGGAVAATGGVDTPVVRGSADGKKSSITFVDTGVNLNNNDGGWGSLHADKADVTSVNAQWVQGRTSADGYISFAADGVNVKTGEAGWGILHADKADVTGVNAKWVQGRATTDGYITFPEDGVNVSTGAKKWGVVHADKADLNGVNTKWVQGRNTTDGWVDFPPHGVCVWANGKHERGTVNAD